VTDVRVGVIGVGNMGAEHVSILHRSVPQAAVTVVAGPDEEQVRGVAAIARARATSDSYALITDPQVDAIVIASPDSTHAALVIAAIRAGKPVMCEKPLAPTVDECVRVVREEQRSRDRLVSLGFMRRFDPAYVELKAALNDGRCGSPLMIRCVSRSVSFDPGLNSELSISGSAVHDFDIVSWLLASAITEVSWHAPRRTSAAASFPDPQLILLHTDRGVLAVVELFLNAGYGYDIRCEVIGENGAISLANQARLITDSARTRSVGFPADWRSRFADAYRLELQAWIGAIVAGRPSALATAHDGLIATAVAEAVIASKQGGGRKIAVQVPAE
jgi:myo-inositol 2-dehydrogenase / D-chiro-inositol 1-dehydrogenase